MTNALTDFEIRLPPPIPPLAEEEPDARLVEGEVVVYPAPRGRALELRFAGPWEPYLTLDGHRVVEDTGSDARRANLWLGRRLPALYRALEHEHGLTATLTLGGVEVQDLVHLDTGARLDHAALRRVLGDCNAMLPPFALLGPVSGMSELQTRVRAMYASGMLLEVRREESGRVLGRRRLRVGR